MSIWIFVQIAFNIVFLLAVWALWSKLSRPAKEDPRLSRGLQLLQSKISVLEDLSDKTDHQVNQLIRLIDRKNKEIQGKIESADKSLSKIDTSLQKSLEVSKIFEDKIPHKEIIERKEARKYVKAAQMAHSGASVEEIVNAVELPASQVEMIIKVNRKNLIFSGESLPSWVETDDKTDDKSDDKSDSVESSVRRPQENISKVFNSSVKPTESLKAIGDEFRRACDEARKSEENPVRVESSVDRVVQGLGSKISEKTSSTVSKIKKISDNAQVAINKVKFDLETASMNILDPVSNLESPVDSINLEEREVRNESSIVSSSAVNRGTVVEFVDEADDIEMTNSKVVSTAEVIPKATAEKKVNVLSFTKKGTLGKATSSIEKVATSSIKKVNFPRVDVF